MIVDFACIRTSIMYKCSQFGIVPNLLEIVNHNRGVGAWGRGAHRHTLPHSPPPLIRYCRCLPVYRQLVHEAAETKTMRF